MSWSDLQYGDKNFRAGEEGSGSEGLIVPWIVGP